MKLTRLYFLMIIFIITLNSPALAMTHQNLKKSYYQSYKYESNKKYSMAIRALKPVQKEYPNSYTVNLRLGWLNYLAGKYAFAIRYYSKAVKIKPESIEAHQGLANAYEIQGQYDNAKKALYAIRSIDKNNYYANLQLVRICKVQEKYIIAEQIIYEMLDLYPIDTYFLTELALIKNIKGDKQKSKQLFQNITILDPNNSSAKLYLKK